VLVTHDIDEALRLGDRLAVLATGGRLEQYGTPAEVLARPATPFVADFVGAGRTLRRLDLLSAADALAPPGDGEGADDVVVPPSATLAEVLGVLLTGDGTALRVVDRERTVGVVTLDSIRRALRRDTGSAGRDADVELEAQGEVEVEGASAPREGQAP
jgi:osmoprotectant transport system ATP-binding protein